MEKIRFPVDYRVCDARTLGCHSSTRSISISRIGHIGHSNGQKGFAARMIQRDFYPQTSEGVQSLRKEEIEICT